MKNFNLFKYLNSPVGWISALRVLKNMMIFLARNPPIPVHVYQLIKMVNKFHQGIWWITRWARTCILLSSRSSSHSLSRLYHSANPPYWGVAKYLLLACLMIVSNAFAEVTVVADEQPSAPTEMVAVDETTNRTTAEPIILPEEVMPTIVAQDGTAVSPEKAVKKTDAATNEAITAEPAKTTKPTNVATKKIVASSPEKTINANEVEAKKVVAVKPEKPIKKTHTTVKKVIAVPPKEPEEQRKNLAGLDEYPAVTELSKKALNLSVGMSRQEVFALLGRPSWVELQQSGKALVWSWDNDVCNPITVTFNKKLRVVGFDQGRINCLKVKFNYKPEKEFLCSNKENDDLCSATADLSARALAPSNLKDVHNKIETNVDEKKASQLPPVEESKALDVIDAGQ